MEAGWQDIQSDNGLTTEEAQEMFSKGQGNCMPKRGEGSAAAIIRRNVFTLFNLLNVALAALLIWVGSYRNVLFLGVVVSNTLIGLIQELRAKRLHDRLRLLSEGKVRVLRDGEEKQLSPTALVLGDVVRLGRGAQVPADAQVLGGECQVDESLLTGESEPVSKAQGHGLKSGSFLTEGQVSARVTAVGAMSYAGALQMAARKVHRPRSELMDSMQALIRVISIALLPLGVLLYAKQVSALGLPLHDGVTKTVAAVLGMIPEGLVLLTSLALTLGAIRLGQQKALVNALYGIEALARTDVICMDKTGTLTSGAMALTQVIPLRNAAKEQIQRCMSALLTALPDSSPTQKAVHEVFGTVSQHKATKVVPFASQRKWSGAQFDEPGLHTLLMGAPEKLLPPEAAENEQAQQMAAKGLRVLLLAASKEPLEGKELPKDLCPLAFLCLEDVLRPFVQDTLRYFEEQGVLLKVISGDHPLTVVSAARAAGLPDADKAIDLSQLQEPIEYDALCEAYTIFGRVTPEDKRELVAALKAKGHGVAMIGDGVNDIPALKEADCSIAMAGGSDAASRVAQITLLDGSFAAMPYIVLEGRRVVGNITRAASLFLVKNIFSFLLAVLLLFLPFAYPFAPIQLTLIAAVTIGIPSFVLALQPSRERIQGRFLRNVIAQAMPGGLTVCLLTLGLCGLQQTLGLRHGELTTFCALSAGMAGLWVLLRACRPLSWLRGMLVAGMTGLLVAALWFFPGIFYCVPLPSINPAVLLGLILFTPLFLEILSRLTTWLLDRGRQAAVHPPQHKQLEG